MKSYGLRKKLVTSYIIFTLILVSFIGILVVDEIDNKIAVSAGTTRYVGGAGAGNFSKIQNAIDNSTTGDIVKVLSGTYYENISINKKIHVIGSGRSSTTIDGSAFYTVRIEADNVKFAGFEIKNSLSSGGILLDDCKNVIVSYNLFSSTCYIYGQYGSNNTIRKNVIDRKPSSMGIGIDIRYTHSNLVEDNTVTNCSYAGIWFRNCSHSKIINNTIKDSGWSIFLSMNANYNIVENNKGTRNNDDIYMSDGRHNVVRYNKFNNINVGSTSYATIYNNTLTSGGFDVSGNKEGLLTHNITTSNTVNGRPFYYWKSITSKTVPKDAGQVILVDCSKVAVSEQNCSNTHSGIKALYSDNLTIKNNICSNNGFRGIELYESNSNLIKNNTINSVKYSGIYLFNSDHNTITENTCTNIIETGIWLMWSSSNNIVFSNYAKKCKTGVGISYNSHNNKIYSNSLDSNSYNGIGTYEAENSVIEYNNLSNNGNGTIIGSGCDNTVFRYNDISFSKDTGLNVQGITIEIYHNNFISNYIQAVNYYGNKNWHKDEEGNYWSDYSGKDNGANGRTAGDGVGDTDIPHLNIDNYPLMNRNGWLYPGTPQLVVPEQIDHDGKYLVKWDYCIRALTYILQEDIDPNFNSPTQIYYGSKFSFTVKGRENGTYYYRAKALGQNYESPWSIVKNVVVNWLPEPPVELRADVYPPGNGLNLSWQSGSVDTVGYKLYANSTGDWEFLEFINGSTIFNHSGLVDGNEYRYKLEAFDELDQVSVFSDELVAVPKDSVAPDTPKNLIGTAESDTIIHLSWLKNPEPDLDGYSIYMKVEDGTNSNDFQMIEKATKKSISTNIWGLTPNTKYAFKIKAYDEVPNYSEFSNLVYVKTPEYDVTPPTKPKGLSVLNLSDDSLLLTWEPNPEDDVVGYYIFRRESAPKSFRKLNYNPLNATKYVDTDLKEVTYYYYKIIAVDDVGLESEESDIVSGKTFSGPRGPEINNSLEEIKLEEDTIDNGSLNLYYLFKDANNDLLEFWCEDQDFVTVIITQETGSVLVVPDPDWSGEDTVTFYAKDKTATISHKIKITVTPVNDPPYEARIISPLEGLQIIEGDLLILEGECKDSDLPDMPNGEILTYWWESSIDGVIGTRDKVLVKDLTPGDHLITLKVSDRAGEYANAFVNITVLEKTDTQESEPGDTTASGIIIIVIIVTVIVVILLLFFRKKGIGISFMKPKTEPIKQETVDQQRNQKQSQVNTPDSQTPQNHNL
jgi:parallel beta-helix repeat protein